MDNNKEQTMQNWKKVLILDPVLNSLFQSSLDVKDFLHQKILTLDHQQIVAIYSKLSSVRHALSKNIQKEVQTKHQSIQKSFLSKHQIENRMKMGNVGEIESLKKSLESFNGEYEVVKEGSVKLENLTKVIRFSKALEKLKINIRLLRTFMKDHLNPIQSAQSQLQSPSSSPTLRTTVTQQSLNIPKVAKLLKQITQLVTKNDFSGIKYYQQQKTFINNAKQTLYGIAEKQLNKTIEKYREIVKQDIMIGDDKKKLREKLNDCAKDIREKLTILNSINKLRQYIPVFGKGIFTSTSQQMKLLFQQPHIDDFSTFLTNQVLPLLLTNSYILIKIQQILYQSSLSQHLQVTYNLPNLFMKYVQHLVSYWRNLINWNMQQDVKEMEKRRLQDKGKSVEIWEEKEMGEIVVFIPSDSIINGKKPLSLLKYKIPLWYKYPTLYNGMCTLVNKLHQQVLLHADYNSKKYEFSQKKQLIMSTLIPLARRFYQKIDNLILNPIKNNNDLQAQMDGLKSKVDSLKWVYDRLLLGQFNQSDIKRQISTIVTGMNEKLMQIIQNFINPSLKEQNSTQQYQSTHKTQSLSSTKLQLINAMLKILDRKQNFMSYNNLQTVIDHLKRVKQIKDHLKRKQFNCI